MPSVASAVARFRAITSDAVGVGVHQRQVPLAPGRLLPMATVSGDRAAIWSASAAAARQVGVGHHPVHQPRSAARSTRSPGEQQPMALGATVRLTATIGVVQNSPMFTRRGEAS